MSDLSLSGTLKGEHVQDALLVLEPRNGGDAQAQANGVFLVEQYKTRNGGTWSIAEIESIIFDLVKSVPQNLPQNANYRFVTDGRPGRLKGLELFLADIRGCANVEEIDDETEKKFSSELIVTNRRYFDRLIQNTTLCEQYSAFDANSRLLHLLKHLHLDFEQSGEVRATGVEKLLRKYAPDLGSERHVREHLVGKLMEILSREEQRLDLENINQLFRDVGLNPERVTRFANLAETMSATTRRRLSKMKYLSDLDVRNPPPWPADKSVLLIAGVSGTGKTWQLGSLLEALCNERQIVTLLTSAESKNDALRQAAQDFWTIGLGDTSNKSLVAVTTFFNELRDGQLGAPLVIAIDDVQDVDLTRALVRQDWAALNVRLVMTVPRSIAQSIVYSDEESVHLHNVDRFSVDELDRLLGRYGQRWADLPPDLREQLRTPILAGLYCALPHTSFQRAPQSEYEILERLWTEIPRKARQDDAGVLLSMADRVLRGPGYPFPRSSWSEIGIASETVLDRLVAAGWLISDERGEVSFAHYRLLNWAAAKTIAERYLAGRTSFDDLMDALVPDSVVEERSMFVPLDYLLMDVFWLVSTDQQQSSQLSRILERIEDTMASGHEIDDLYIRLLPSLGQRVVNVLLDRLRIAIEGDKRGHTVDLIARSLAQLALQDHSDLGNAITGLLHDNSHERQQTAMVVLAGAPDVAHLDRLWRLHQQRVSDLEDRSERPASWYTDYEESMAALRVAVEIDPDWLRRQIRSANPNSEHISELAYLLVGMESSHAKDIWTDTRDTLFEKVDPKRPRSLLSCIGRFLDYSKKDFVIDHLGQTNDFAAGTALAALSALDPADTIDRLSDVDEGERYFYRNQWLPILLHTNPEATRLRILELAKGEAKGQRLIELLFWERPNQIDVASLEFILSELKSEIQVRKKETLSRNTNWPHHTFEFLSRISAPILLDVLFSKRCSELEWLITEVALSRIDGRSMDYDHTLENSRKILLKIGGDGITRLVLKELESEQFWGRHGGINWGYVRSDGSIIQALRRIACRPVSRDEGGKVISEDRQEFYLAVQRLGALGADKALVESVWQARMWELPLNLGWIRKSFGPMPEQLTRRVVETLTTPDQREEDQLVALSLAWISADNNLIPIVQEVGRNVPPHGLLARMACLALCELRDDSEFYKNFAVSLANTADNSYWGLSCLMALGSDGAKTLAGHLDTLTDKDITNIDSKFINFVFQSDSTKDLGLKFAHRICCSNGFALDARYDIAAEQDDPVLRDRIVDKAFTVRSSFNQQVYRAIQGLAKFDTPRAVEAIELALENHPSIERELCFLLARVDPSIAIEKLVETAVRTKRDGLRRAIGRTLRQLNPASVHRELVMRMSLDASDRKVAAELAGWVSTESVNIALRDLIDRDQNLGVRAAALDALDKHTEESILRELIAMFQCSGEKRRWAMLESILELADPFLLETRDDHLCIDGWLIEDTPPAFYLHATEVINQRKKKEK